MSDSSLYWGVNLFRIDNRRLLETIQRSEEKHVLLS